MNRSKTCRGARCDKAELYKALEGLHAAHANDSIISIMTGFSRTYCRRTLDDMGLKQKWHDVQQFSSTLPSDLVVLCAKLQSRNKSPSKR